MWLVPKYAPALYPEKSANIQLCTNFRKFCINFSVYSFLEKVALMAASTVTQFQILNISSL